MEIFSLALFVLVVILIFKHWTTASSALPPILIGILAGYVAAFVMGLVLPTTGVTADGVEFTKHGCSTGIRWHRPLGLPFPS